MPDRDEQHPNSESEAYWSRWSLTNRGRVPASWAAALRDDPMLRSASVVVDLSLGRGQRRILLGPKPVAIAAGRSGGAPLAQAELLSEPELSESISIGEPGPSGRSVAVSVAGRLVTPKAVLATGWPLAGRGEISLVADGVSWDDRLVWVRGPTAGGFQFGTNDEFVDLTVDDPPTIGAELPPWILDETRWPNIPGSSVGQRVPIVIGCGILPCPRVDVSPIADTEDPDYPGGVHDEWVVGWGHNLTVEKVWIAGTLATETTDYDVRNATDDLGLQVTTIRFTATAVAAADGFAEVHARVTGTSTAGLDLAVSIRTLLRDFGGFSGDRLSDRLFAESQARAGAFGPPATGIGAPRLVINAPAGALDFVSNGLLKSYPYVSMVWDGAGVGPVAIDHRAPPVAALTRGLYPATQRPEGGRYSETPLSDLRTGFLLSWNFDPVQNTFRSMSLRSRQNNALCKMAAAAIGGDQVEDAIESVTIADSSTAEFVLDWLCEHKCRPAYEVDVECYPIAWFMLRLGDTVTWTDDHVGFDAVKAIVVGRTWSGGLVTIRIRCFPSLWKVGGGSWSYQTS